ncbi:MAG: hypothetical protein ACLFV3_05925 [Phycisphaeraceae bacterium]
MIHRHMRTLVAVVAAALAPLCFAAEPWEDAIPLQENATFLTVGNSLTGRRSGGVAGYMDLMLQKEPGFSIQWGRLSKWGKGLDVHTEAENYQGAGGSEAEGLVRADEGVYANILKGPTEGADAWDVVVLQGYEFDKREDPTTFFNYVRRLDQAIRKQGGHTVLFARYGGYHGSFEEFAELQNRLDAHYTRIGRELGATVVPTSKVFLEAARDENRPEGADKYWLYSEDHGHPNNYGKAAYMYAFYGELARRSPLGVNLADGIIADLDPEKDAALQQIAWDVVQQQAEWDDPGYLEPARNGAVAGLYDPDTGEMKLTITGEVTGVRLGSPNAALMKPGSAPELADQAPVQADEAILAWYDEAGLAEGTYDLGQIAEPGTPVEKLFFAFTPGKGDVAEVNLIAP